MTVTRCSCPPGSSAYSATVCFALGDWHLRFLMRNVGSQTGGLHVQVVVPSLLGGLLTVLDGGTVQGNGLGPVSAVAAPARATSRACSGRRRSRSASRRTGRGAAYQIDDVYLDPWKST